MFKVLSVCKGGGYRYCRTEPPHPRRNAKGLYPLHIVLAENKLGRLLVKGEQVHHKNEDKTDDTPENLEVKSVSQHAREHALERAPPPEKVTCGFCGAVFMLKPHLVRHRLKRSASGKLFCGLSCAGYYRT